MHDTLRTEIQNDPLLRGYLAMSDEQVAVSLNTANRSIDRTIIPSNEVAGAIVWSEYTASSTTANARSYLTMLVSAGDVDVRNPNTRAAFAAIFGATTTTRANLVALQTRSVSRAQELGITRPVEPIDVTRARA